MSALASVTERVSPRSLALILAAVPIIGLAAGWAYVFKQPLAQLRLTGATLSSRTGSITDIDHSGRIEALKREIARLEGTMASPTGAMPEDVLIPYVMGQLDLLAAEHAVRLVSVTPGPGERAAMFDATPFTAEVRGEYFDLYRWLYAVETRLAPMVTRAFTIERTAGGDELRLLLQLASYRSPAAS